MKILIGLLLTIALVGCSSGESGSSDSGVKITSGEGAVIYSPVGDGSYNIDCEANDGGDCVIEINNIEDSVLDGDHFFGDGHTDAATCPFAEDNVEADL